MTVDRQSQKAIAAGRAAHDRLANSHDPLLRAYARGELFRRDEERARLAAIEGIPLACAGSIGYTLGGTRWLHIGEWFYQGLDARVCAGCNVTLVATPETGMSAEEFGRLWRGVVKDLMRVAKCVRVRLREPAKEI